MNDLKRFLYGPASVPANASRLHLTKASSLLDSDAKIGFEIDSLTGVLVNSLFDESKIVYDRNYCTTNVDISGKAIIPTLSYFAQCTEKHGPFNTIVDIGCGQGEFVEVLRSRGLNCTGFDPVLAETNEYLMNRFWTQRENPADLFVMRCVLPHLANPWKFLETIWLNSPTALVLVEYQRIEWIAENSIFSQISHDHVQQFVLSDFEEHVEIVDHGMFAEGEWQWVLVRKRSLSKEKKSERNDAREKYMEALENDRSIIVEGVKSLIKQGKNITIWGAGSKGAIFADHLLQQGVSEFSVVDSDTKKEGRYLEKSGIRVCSPTVLKKDTEVYLVIVMNPRHVEYVQSNIQRTHKVVTLKQLAN